MSMSTRAFGKDRHRPSGEWIQTTPLLAVAGSHFRREDVQAYAKAVLAAEKKQLHYGLEVVRDGDNPHDRNAVKVIGRVTVKSLFREPKTQRWHIGYVPADIAGEISPTIIDAGHAYAAELYDVQKDGSDVGIRFFILLPSNSPVKNWRAESIATEAVKFTDTLTTDQKQLIRLRSLGLYRNTRLEQAEALKKVGDFDGAFAMYLRVAWLDAQGVRNVGTIDGRPSGVGMPFDRDSAFLAPGIVKAIAQAANSLGLDADELSARAADAAQVERVLIARLKPPVDDQAAWAMFSQPVSEVMATSTKWRSGRAKI